MTDPIETQFPVPWRSVYMQVQRGLRRWMVLDAKGERIAEVLGKLGDNEIAQRITACVNACNGITTSELHLVAGKGGFVPGYVQMQQQRDELQAENERLRKLVAKFSNYAIQPLEEASSGSA